MCDFFQITHGPVSKNMLLVYDTHTIFCLFVALVTDSGRRFWLCYFVRLQSLFQTCIGLCHWLVYFVHFFFKGLKLCASNWVYTWTSLPPNTLQYPKYHTHLFKNWTALYKNIYTLLNLCNSFDPVVTLNVFSFTKCELNVSSLMASCKVWQSYVYCPRKSAIVVGIIQPAIPVA